MKHTSVLFVCLGNICRSPAGENVFRHMVKEAGLNDRIHCDSAGTIGYHTGNDPDARMSRTIRNRGYEVTGFSRQISLRDFKDFDLILTMDEVNYTNVIALTKNDEQRARVKRFTDFCTEHEEKEVPDPYYGGDQGFELVADMIEDGSRGVLDSLTLR
ncbi:low molecular weight phosphotyrosine protein phosphatase [Akkermansiaceae bacterium]|nr:low molecular weight phosphotyrosine protein phosphatase [Akkermansiaceae bacterium]